MTDDVLGIPLSSKWRLGKFVVGLSFLGGYMVYLLSISLLTLRLSLFAMSQLERDLRSLLALDYEVLRSLCKKNMFVLSANSLG